MLELTVAVCNYEYNEANSMYTQPIRLIPCASLLYWHEYYELESWFGNTSERDTCTLLTASRVPLEINLVSKSPKNIMDTTTSKMK